MKWNYNYLYYMSNYNYKNYECVGNLNFNLIIFNVMHDSNYPIIQILVEKNINNQLQFPSLNDSIGVEEYSIQLINELLKNNFDASNIFTCEHITFQKNNFIFIDSSCIDFSNLFYEKEDTIFLVTIYEILQLKMSYIYPIASLVSSFFSNKKNLELIYFHSNIEKAIIPICGYTLSTKDQSVFTNIFGISSKQNDLRRVYVLNSNINNCIHLNNDDPEYQYLNKICVGGKYTCETDITKVNWDKIDFILFNEKENNKIFFKNQTIQIPLCCYKIQINK